MKAFGFVLLALAAAAIAWCETVKYNALEDLEQAFEAKLARNPGKYPFEVMFSSAGVYVPGMGVTLSNRVNLVYSQPPSPFRPAFSAEELAALHDRKLEKIAVLEQNMREVMADAAASPGLDAIPPSEHISLGVSLFYYKWENQAGLPHQITMTAEKQKLLQARRDKVDLATVIQEIKL